MKLRTRLTIVFSVLVAIIIFIFSFFIYLSSEDFRSEQFVERLRDKANTTIKLLVEVQEVDKPLLEIIDRNTRSLINEFICIFKSNGDLVYASYPYNDEISILRNEINNIKSSKEHHFKYKLKEAIGITYHFEEEKYYVIASATDTYGIGKIRYLKWLLVFSFSVSIFVILLTGFIFSRQALTPITQVINQMEKISASNLNIRLKEQKNRDEIYFLTHTFNKMLDRIEEAFNLQKNFVRDASHELRTPLTSITSQIDVTLLKERNNKEYEDTLTSIREDISKINAMVNSLLQLAQSHTDLLKISSYPIRIDEVLFECQKEMQKIHTDFSAKIEWGKVPESDNECYVIGNEQLLKTVFYNLSDNAYKFSDNKKVRIIITITQKNIEIIFKNTGQTLNKDEHQKVFEPFFRGCNSQSTPGSGIGLSLAKKILEFHSGEIYVISSCENETTILVTLPRKTI